MNTLVVRDGMHRGRTTDAEILGSVTSERPLVIGDGGSATALHAASPRAHEFSHAATGRPRRRDADLVVNATPVRDEVLVELGRAQTLIDLPYPETATAKAPARPAQSVISGLEALVAQARRRSSSGRACRLRSRSCARP